MSIKDELGGKFAKDCEVEACDNNNSQGVKKQTA
jgi:hypothetical protein